MSREEKAKAQLESRIQHKMDFLNDIYPRILKEHGLDKEKAPKIVLSKRVYPAGYNALTHVIAFNPDYLATKNTNGLEYDLKHEVGHVPDRWKMNLVKPVSALTILCVGIANINGMSNSPVIAALPVITAACMFLLARVVDRTYFEHNANIRAARADNFSTIVIAQMALDRDYKRDIGYGIKHLVDDIFCRGKGADLRHPSSESIAAKIISARDKEQNSSEQSWCR